jgi:hypothetical protein
MIVVHLPRSLADEFGAPTTLRLGPEADVAGVIARLDALYPGVRQRLTEVNGELRPHLSAFVGEADTRRRGGVHTDVPDGADIWFFRAISGG